MPNIYLKQMKYECLTRYGCQSTDKSADWFLDLLHFIAVVSRFTRTSILPSLILRLFLSILLDYFGGSTAFWYVEKKRWGREREKDRYRREQNRQTKMRFSESDFMCKTD